MFNKAFRLFLYITIIATGNVNAQNITKSPYSIVGAGDLVFGGNASNLSMGRVTQGIRNPYEVNWLNPASYSSILQTNIETGIIFSRSGFKSLGNSTSSNNAWLSYINLAMPLSTKRGIGFSFGIAPFTSVGYDVSSNITLVSDTNSIFANNKFLGNGGLSKTYIGAGFRLTKNLSFGINGAFVFGQVNQRVQLVIPPAYRLFNVEERAETYMTGFMYDLGLQYHKNFNKDYILTIGATVTPQTIFNGSRSYVVRTMPIGITTGTKDTVINLTDMKGNVSMPMFWNAGFSLAKENKWLVAADINGARWSNYSAFNRTDSLQNSFGLSLGGSYIPKYAAPKNIFNRLEYRAGISYNKTNWQFFGQSINALSLSCGVGIPLAKSKSKVSVGFEYVNRGTTSNNLVQENFYRFILGVSFSDKWFYRYRYD
ncbi:MAG: hypothetical protein ACK4K9_03440 [Bacteroidia bacterium]